VRDGDRASYYIFLKSSEEVLLFNFCFDFGRDCTVFLTGFEGLLIYDRLEYCLEVLRLRLLGNCWVLLGFSSIYYNLVNIFEFYFKLMFLTISVCNY
jgi:hypothetical protein